MLMVERDLHIRSDTHTLQINIQMELQSKTLLN